ncbi:MAG TPA: hypothetical protein VNU20_11900 [Candidatus Sulfotelmatobacter sp.]|nr:hypothetical protein [Candidatus Sulfotelmatobacter sp.]
MIAVLAAICCVFRPVAADGDAALRETAQRLAERVAAIPGLHGPLRLEWHPDATWSEGESQRWIEKIRDELERRALDLTGEAGAPVLDVFAVETPTQVVLTAKTLVSDRDEVRIMAFGRALLPRAASPAAPIQLERQRIYESPDRILDASSVQNGDERGLVLLVYRNYELMALRVDARGVVKQSVSLNPANWKPSRDPRGEIRMRGSVVSVELPGKTCEFSWESPADLKCRAEKSAWRAEALLTSPCDRSDWKLVSSGSEPNAKDVLQVLPDGTLRESSAAVLSEFPGPILSNNGEQDPSSALVIARNLRTGNYEVYKITLACGN